MWQAGHSYHMKASWTKIMLRKVFFVKLKVNFLICAFVLFGYVSRFWAKKEKFEFEPAQFLVICAAGYRSSANTIGILFQKYIYSSFSLKMVLNCVPIWSVDIYSWSRIRHQEGIRSKCSALKLGNVPSILVQTIDRKSREASWPIFLGKFFFWELFSACVNLEKVRVQLQ